MRRQLSASWKAYIYAAHLPVPVLGSPRMSVHRAAVVLLAGCAAHGPSAPEVTDVTYAPMQIPVGVRSSIDGQAGYRDPDADVRQIVLGIVDPTGALSEAPPTLIGAATATIGGTTLFRLSITAPVAGRYYLSVRFTDATDLSSEPAERPVDAQ